MAAAWRLWGTNARAASVIGPSQSEISATASTVTATLNAHRAGAIWGTARTTPQLPTPATQTRTTVAASVTKFYAGEISSARTAHATTDIAMTQTSGSSS